MTTLHLKKSIGRSPWRGGFLLIPLVLACFALLPRAQAATPEQLTALPDEAVLGFNTRDGLNALISLTSGQFNTAIGFAALKKDNSGSHNTAVGAQALLQNTIGGYNTAIGENAMVSNTTGNQNMALGQGALANNTGGSSNTAMGFQALNGNTATGNTAVGFQALFSNTTGTGNTAVGGLALGFGGGGGNTAVGDGALAASGLGNHNTAVGVGAAENVGVVGGTKVGNGNTAIGFNALLNAFGSNNIAVGDNAGANLNTLFSFPNDNTIEIGNAGEDADSGTIRIGNASQFRTFIAGIHGVNEGGAGIAAVYINSAGQLGTTPPPSSRRFKKEIKPMAQTSEAILGLKPVTFYYKSDTKDTPQFGLIAEEVAQVNPDLVVRDDKGEIYTVRYDAVNAMLLNEFLKEHRTVEEQKATIVQLKQDFQSKLAEQQKQIKALASGLEKVSAQVEVSKPAPQTVLNQ